jgi:rubrerythrin
MTANFRELLQKAIAIEAKMAEFYGTLAAQATTPETSEILKILAGEENEHRVLLENYLEIGIFPQVPKVSESDLEPTLKVVGAITQDTAPADALACALRSEECQHKFYEKLSQEYPSGLVQNFLKRMADMELVHKERVEKLQRWFSRGQG